MSACKNVGTVDRGIRALIGLAAVVAAFTSLGALDGSASGIGAAVVGVVMLGTAAIGTCPLYLPLGVSTCRAAKR